MTTTVQIQSEYRDLPLDWLVISPTNPRKTFDEDAMRELAASIRENGVLQPLLVRPRAERSFEIVFGERRYRGAAMAEKETVPVCIREMTDAQVLEAQLVENLQRRDVHPLEEARGMRALLELDEPKYSIELIAAKTGKSSAYCAARLRLTELAPVAVDAFLKDEIGVGHALLLAKLQPSEQEQALAHCFREDWSNGNKAKRILLPVRQLQGWIEQNILLILKDAPFSKRDAQLVPAAGSCLECPKRTGFNKLLFTGISENSDACSDPACYAAKLDAHVKKTVAAKPKLVQITTAYGKPAEGSTLVPRGQYVEIRQEKPKNKYQQEAPEYKTCKFATQAIVADGTDKGELRKVCANPDCPVHHPKKQQRRPDSDAATKAAQEKQRREEAIANTTGIRVLAAIANAVPVRLMKRDLLFVVERLAGLVEERRLEIIARRHSIKREKDSDSIAKLFTAYLRRAEESVLGSALVELTIMLTAARQQTTQVLNDAANLYKVDTDAIAAKVKQEFAARDKARAEKKPAQKPPAKQQAKTAKKSAAA
jgi:ParB family chromosome partitioning protein